MDLLLLAPSKFLEKVEELLPESWWGEDGMIPYKRYVSCLGCL